MASWHWGSLPAEYICMGFSKKMKSCCEAWQQRVNHWTALPLFFVISEAGCITPWRKTQTPCPTGRITAPSGKRGRPRRNIQIWTALPVDQKSLQQSLASCVFTSAPAAQGHELQLHVSTCHQGEIFHSCRAQKQRDNQPPGEAIVGPSGR